MKSMDVRSEMYIYERSKVLNIYLDELRQYQPLQAEEEVELAYRAKSGDKDAEGKLIRSNLRFVVSIAKRYQKKDIPIEDIIMAGNMGLLEAVRRYDPSTGFRFISYAVWWIRQSIILFIARYNGINTSQAGVVKKVKEKMDRYYKLTGCELDIEDLEKSERNTYMRYNIEKVSLDAPVKDGESYRNLDRLGKNDDNIIKFEQRDSKLNLRDFLKKNLSEEEYEILKAYYGIDRVKQTLDSLGQEYGVTRERIRQIIKRIKKKLRQKYGDELKELLAI